jgi:phage terminase large subunit
VKASGLDTAYSTKSPDTIAMSFLGITNMGRCIVLDEKVYNNASLDTPIAPSDTVQNYIDFLERNRRAWGMARNVFVDSADQATLTELAK